MDHDTFPNWLFTKEGIRSGSFEVTGVNIHRNINFKQYTLITHIMDELTSCFYQDIVLSIEGLGGGEGNWFTFCGTKIW